MKNKLLKLLKKLDCKKGQLQKKLGITANTWFRIMTVKGYAENTLEKDFKHKLENKIEKLLNKNI